MAENADSPALGRRIVLHRPLVSLAMLALGGMASCAASMDTHSMQSPKAHFDAYHSLAFDARTAPPGNYAPSPQSADVRARVRQAAEQMFQARGYSLEAQDKADLIVTIETGRREREVSAPGNTLGLSPDTPSRAPNYEEPAAPPYHGFLDEEERERVEGALVIDAFDAKTRELVWHGYARAEVDPGKVDYERVKRAVEAVLASFPPAPAAVRK